MTRQMTQAFSAPGKALLAGGYLVLDPSYSAYVVALSARLHAVISGLPQADNQTIITCTSPQFQDGRWIYKYCLKERKLVQVEGNNPFLEAVLTAVLAYTNPNFSSNITMTIFSDDEYHSQDHESSVIPNHEDYNMKHILKRQFHSHTRPISNVPKTGLGSSAALTVAATAAFLSYYMSELELTNQKHLQLIHNLSQVAHCTAQGKVGSGFDIASAVFGSVIYRRFPPNLLSDAGIFDTDAPDYSSKIKQLVDSRWDMKCEPCALPNGLSLLMGDVEGGSETPSMVKTVLSWKNDNPERAHQLWTSLNDANMTMVNTLSQLERVVYKEYSQGDSQIGSDSNDSNKASMLLQQLKNNFTSIRKYLQIMTHESGAAIEPLVQTKMLDACYSLNGVYGGVVPGAGGYDAISLVVDSNIIEDIKSASKEISLLSHIKWLQLKEQAVGLQVEFVESYPQIKGTNGYDK